MLVLVAAFLLLVCAPAGLLVLGRAIAGWTDFEARRGAVPQAVAPEAGQAWYFRPMRPAFKWRDADEGEPGIGETGMGQTGLSQTGLSQSGAE